MADDVIRVLDLNSTVGEVAESYILMAVSDFYAVNANYQTRLSLFTKDFKDYVVGKACTGNYNSHTHPKRLKVQIFYILVELKLVFISSGMGKASKTHMHTCTKKTNVPSKKSLLIQIMRTKECKGIQK